MWTVTASALERYVSHHDADAFRALVLQYQDMVYGTCARVLGGGAEVDDAVQDTFIKLAKKASEIRSNPGAWLHACARTTALNILKTRRRRRGREQRLDRHVSQAASADTVGERVDQASVVDACLDELPDIDREVVISYFFIEHSQEEIAKRIGVTQGAIQQRLDRVLEVLRRKFIRRGLAVSGLMAGFFSQLAATSAIPPELAHRLAGLHEAALHSAVLSSQATVSGLSAKSMTLSLKSLFALTAAIAIGAGVYLASATVHAPSPLFQASWDFTMQAPELQPLFGHWQWQAPRGSVAGGLYVESSGPDVNWTVLELPVAAPAKPLVAALRFHFQPDYRSTGGFSFGWLFDHGQSTDYRRWDVTDSVRRLAVGESRTYHFYLIGDFVMLADGEKLIDLYQYEPGHQTDRLYLRFANLVIEAIEVREIDAHDIPQPLRDPLKLIDELKLKVVGSS
jgi:RNA polymerase sigma factor (sigma-70 family)